MSTLQKLGALTVACLFTAAAVAPAYAQRRGGSGAAARGGSAAAPRSPQRSGPSAGQRPSQGGGEKAVPRAAQNPGRGGAYPGQGPGYRPGGSGPGYRPAYGPGYRPGYGHYPGYGYRGYPYYGYRGYYPAYGYRGYYSYGYPWYYSGLYVGFGGYYGPSYYGAGPSSSYAYSDNSGYGSDSGGAGLKIEVKPKTAEVYIDGYLAGIVDQFDGMFDSLPLEPGEHEITIYQEGFRSIRQRLNLSPGSSYRVKGALEPLAPGEPNEPRPQPPSAPPGTDTQMLMSPQAQQDPQYQAPEPQGPPPARMAPAAPAPETFPPMAGAGDSRFGQVAVRVQPADAEVLIDGEPWRSPAGADRLVVFLAPGTHRIEIRKEGFDPFVTAVEIRRGEVTPLNVSLARF